MSDLKTRAKSKREEVCRGCGDPFFVCPCSIDPKTPAKGKKEKGRSGYRLLRCCDSCSHWGKADIDWAKDQLRKFQRR